MVTLTVPKTYGLSDVATSTRPAPARPITVRRAGVVLATGAAAGMLASGFWHVRAVDGLGLALFVTPFVGPFEGLAAGADSRGAGFGLLFAVLAGLAATCTASNVAGFTMLPVLLLAGARAARPASVLRLLAIMAGGVAAVGLLYGAFHGRLGPDGAAAFNVAPVRSAQSFTVYGAIGVLMLGWAAVEAGLARTFTGRVDYLLPPTLRSPSLVAAGAGLVIGLFTIGRPLAVFREALMYAASSGSVPYAAAVGAFAALATLTGFAVVLVALTRTAGDRIAEWTRTRVDEARLVAAGALAAGGAFLIFYWAISRLWPAMGRWGFALGWYA